MHARGTELAWMVTLAGDSCDPQFIQTYVGGENWAVYDDRIAGTWYLDPAGRDRVHSPQGDKDAPCDTVVGLASRDANSAAVLCSDHSVFRTTDAAKSWSIATPVPGAVTLAGSADGFTIAATGQSGCDGVAIAIVDSGASSATTTGCVTTPVSSVGAVALADTGERIWLWIGDALVLSGDSGTSWQ